LYYDPMIAKLVAYGPNRDAAIARLRNALDGFYIGGVRHNVAFLAAVADSERFHDGALSTDFIADTFPGGFAPPSHPVAADRVILRAAALAECRLREAEQPPPTAIDAEARFVVLLDKRRSTLTVVPDGAAYRVAIDGESCLAATDWRPGNPLMHLRV